MLVMGDQFSVAPILCGDPFKSPALPRKQRLNFGGISSVMWYDNAYNDDLSLKPNSESKYDVGFDIGRAIGESQKFESMKIDDAAVFQFIGEQPKDFEEAWRRRHELDSRP